MRLALTYFLVGTLICAPLAGAERKSWNKLRYVGGTIPVKSSPYDWNTTLTVQANPDLIVISIAPATVFRPAPTIRIQPSQVLSIFEGPGAWRRVSEVTGAQLPKKPPTLFGVMREHHFYFGLIYETDDRKTGAILLDGYFNGQILEMLKGMTGKEVEFLRQ